MPKLILSKHLRERIVALEEQRNYELVDLKHQYHSLLETVKPSNLIKQSFSNVYNSSLDKKAIFAGITTLIAGYFSKKLVVGSSKSPVKKMLGNLFQVSIPFLITKLYKNEEEEVVD